MNNEDVLNECLEAILGGETEESCLERYPEQAAELRPLLRMAISTRGACCVSPQLEYRTRARYEYRCVVTDACAKSAKYGFRWSWRWSTAAPLAIAVVMVMSGGVMAASTNALPGQPLYGVKLAAEEMQIRLTPAGEERTMAYALLVDRRIDEMTTLAGRGDYSRVSEVSLRLDGVLNEMAGYLQVAGVYGGQRGDVASTGPSIEAPPEVTVMITPAPTIVAGSDLCPSAWDEPNSAKSDITLPAGVTPTLFNEVQSKAAQAKDALLALMENMPEGAQKALENSIANCDAILNAQPVPMN